jgi:hypothetical protein
LASELPHNFLQQQYRLSNRKDKIKMMKTITPLVFVGILATASYMASNGGANQPEAQVSP